MSDTYNGWTDWTTWSVALWIGNDEGIYQIAQSCKDFDEFVAVIETEATPDGAVWDQADADEMQQLWNDF